MVYMKRERRRFRYLELHSAQYHRLGRPKTPKASFLVNGDGRLSRVSHDAWPFACHQPVGGTDGRLRFQSRFERPGGRFGIFHLCFGGSTLFFTLRRPLPGSLRGREIPGLLVRGGQLPSAGRCGPVLYDGGREIHPFSGGEVAAYRDRLIPADERNEGMVGVNADWILSSRLTLGFEQSFRWLGYLNWAKPFSGKGQGRNPNGEGKKGQGGAHASNSAVGPLPSSKGSNTPERERARSTRSIHRETIF
jgi:hypothetical protein